MSRPDVAPRPLDSASEDDAPVTPMLAAFLAGAVLLYQVYHLGLQIQSSIPALWDQMHMPYAINLWSEPPILIQILRIAAGHAPYRPVFLVDSWIYGPLYPYLLAFLDRLVAHAPAIITLRFISMWIGALTALPLLAALLATRRRLPGPRSPWATPLAMLFTLTTFALVETRATTFAALHPDPLSFFLMTCAIAATLWYPFARPRNLMLVVICALCFIQALCKLNTAAQLPFFLAALVIGGHLNWRKALIALGAYVLALALFHAAIPDAMRQWILIIPLHHTYHSLPVVFQAFEYQLTGARPWAGFMVLATVGVVLYYYFTARQREAYVWATILAGASLGAVLAFATAGGGPNDLWPIYVACLIPLGAFLDEALGVIDGSLASIIGLRVAALAYVCILPGYTMTGTYLAISMAPQALAELNYTAAQLRALCPEGHTVLITWLVDPLLDCPGAHFVLWDSGGEIGWARQSGYKTETMLDSPVAPDAFVQLTAHPYVQPTLAGRYKEVTLPVYSREMDQSGATLYVYNRQYLQVWTRSALSR